MSAGVIIMHSFYIVLFSALEQTHRANWHVILNEWLHPFIARIINIHGSGVLIALSFYVTAGTIIGGSCHNIQFCHNKSFVVTSLLLSRQKYFVNTNIILSWQAYFCHDKRCFVVTKMVFVEHPPMIRNKAAVLNHTCSHTLLQA